MKQFNNLTKVFLTALLVASTLFSFGQNLEKFQADNGKYGFKDSTGKVVVEAKYDDVYDFSKGLAKVFIGDWNNGKWGFINKEGKEIVPCKYNDVNNFSEGLARVQ